MEYHILDKLYNHEKSYILGHQSTFYHLSSENKELSASCLSIMRLQLLKVPLTKDIQVLANFSGGGGKGYCPKVP